jgi:nicotinamidase-related amidase
MRRKNPSLHGNAPDKASTALVIIDVINDLEFPEGKELLQYALPMASRIADLKRQARIAKLPVIYANDNFGRWQSNFNTQVDHCLNDGVLGRPIVEILQPEDEDYFVLKPKHSAFYCTVLDILLDYLQTDTVILTGIAGNICVLFTAHDAYLRDLRLFVPRDCLASNTVSENRAALEQMEKILKADIRPSELLDLATMNRRDRSEQACQQPSDADMD